MFFSPPHTINPDSPYASLKAKTEMVVYHYIVDCSFGNLKMTSLVGSSDLISSSLEMTKIDIMTSLNRYNFSNPDSEIPFILDNPSILTALCQAQNIIPQFFGENTKLNLSLFEDIEEEVRNLNIFIEHQIAIDKAIEVELEFHEIWFVKNFPELTSKINFREISL